MAVKITSKALYGMREPLPLSGFPEGTIKLKVRSNGFVTAYVRTSKSIRQFLVKEKDGFWKPYMETKSNTKGSARSFPKRKSLLSKILTT